MLLGDLIEHLKTFTDVTNEVGDRLFINRAPTRASWPYVIVSRYGGDTPYSLAGEVGTTETAIQIVTWAKDPNGTLQADNAASAIRDKLSGYRGLWGERFINACTLENEPTDLTDDAGDGSNDDWHGVSQDYRVTHAQGLPTLS